MNDGVLLLFLRKLFPEWAITRDRDDVWRATGRVHISASSSDGLLEMLAVAEPSAAERVARFFGSCSEDAEFRAS
ncbi:hypothetical protein [Actinomadura algeriensis]|uniref:Uncharacterized protein n=1 Tax=Actinomadura algeriensis TaxID=1679523 RepID=A0ABR9JKZ1_9ACTN|nr:hypothetical protein [Actinomadura algeriensis]MBE1531093.1 hypothetical protein [Actinomadura algeriensis]